jgi:putative Ca2+/H+ antiporter (TMEM165/GDT1 family)
MRHDRFIVFAGAFGSLVVMSILSAAMGHLLPTLIPKSWTQAAAAVLFLVFGIRMLLEAREMKSGNEKIQEEMREVQEEIELEAAEIDGIHVNGRAAAPEAMEEGVERKPAPKGIASDLREGVRNFCSLLFGPTFVQAFILTFLGEWGDRSQIATIALAAAHVRVLFRSTHVTSQHYIFRICTSLPLERSLDTVYARLSR